MPRITPKLLNLKQGDTAKAMFFLSNLKIEAMKTSHKNARVIKRWSHDRIFDII